MSVRASEIALPTPAAAEPRWARLRRLTRDPLGLVGLVLVATVAAMAIGADWLTGYSPTTLNVRERLLDPSWRHLLGTDHLGRDIFTRVVFGARIALGIALASTGLALVGGLALGLNLPFGGPDVVVEGHLNKCSVHVR